jgi:hypothetical protein
MGSEAGPSVIPPHVRNTIGNSPSSDEDDYIDSPHEHTDDEYDGPGEYFCLKHVFLLFCI